MEEQKKRGPKPKQQEEPKKFYCNLDPTREINEKAYNGYYVYECERILASEPSDQRQHTTTEIHLLGRLQHDKSEMYVQAFTKRFLDVRMLHNPNQNK